MPGVHAFGMRKPCRPTCTAQGTEVKNSSASKCRSGSNELDEFSGARPESAQKDRSDLKVPLDQ